MTAKIWWIQQEAKEEEIIQEREPDIIKEVRKIRMANDNIVIVGGGLVGLSQAIALAQEGIAVTVIDCEVADTVLQATFDGRTCAIAWKSYTFLDKICFRNK